MMTASDISGRTFRQQPFSSPGEALKHYGVKGMKWGVRKDRPTSGRSTETRQQRKEAKKAAADYIWNSIKDEPMWHTMTEAEYKSLSTAGETFAKGTELQRVVVGGKTPTETTGVTYVSKTLEDANFYRAILPTQPPGGDKSVIGPGGRKKYKQDSYEVVMRTTKKLSMPSEKERFDAFYELMSEPSIKLNNNKAPITGREFLERNGYKQLFKNPTDQQLAFMSYRDFVQGQGSQGSQTPLNKAYFNKLKNRGFNALPDDTDKGVLTKNPLILITPENTVKITSVKKLTADEINQAQRNLAKVKRG